MSKTKATIETITPQIAKQMLAKNICNRKMRDRHVNRLVSSIKKGQWKLNGAAIVVSKAGNLMDGQHRLTAAIIAKMPIETVVVRDAPESAKTTIDTGAARNCGDHLKMQGYKGAVYALAAAVGVCLSFKSGKYVESRMKLTPDDMLEYIHNNKSILKSQAIFERDIDLQQLLPQSVSMSLYHLFCKIDRDKAESFFYHLSKGLRLGEASPILKLRTELIGLRTVSKRSDWSRKVFLWHTVNAFEAYMNNKRITSLEPYKPAATISLPKKKG